MKWCICCVGNTSKKFVAKCVELNDEVICFLDNSETKQGNYVDGVPVFAVSKATEIEYERIAIPEQHYAEIKMQLLSLGVLENKIVKISGWNPQTRIDWLEDYSLLWRNTDGCVAEAGVFRGEFAVSINQYFPNDLLYLFDTFEGLPPVDVDVESTANIAEEKNYDSTSVELVMSKLPHPEKAIIRKGYFPDTAVNLPGGFKFVNLDLDLYAPTLKGLRLFYPKMVCGSVILIHDYFPDYYPGVKQAVTEFEEELISTGHERLLKIPVGDRISIAIIKR